MRTLAIGDIHGCLDALLTLGDFVGLDPQDRLITLGDYVDRGPNSRAVVDWLIDWSSRGQLIPLLGNHEAMMMAAHRDVEMLGFWRGVGGAETMTSYSAETRGDSLDGVPESHWEFFDNCLLWYETPRHIFVHAGLDHRLELDDQSEEKLLWDRFIDPQPHVSGKTMICGHTRLDGGVPRNLGHAICIDTAACAGGWLTCLQPETGHYWQANEQSETREGDLEMV